MAAIARKGFSQLHFVCQLAEEALVKVAQAVVKLSFGLLQCILHGIALEDHPEA